ncbi:hypothetical protein GIB67_006116 [Kingdonia uniflora]|uniref:Calmodulin-binding heat-shock protein n=1 Tax=Kingdonia uniflora TaxID=39325 RepID=A0A7J7LQ50_9MAGN|nr:hypothetical protein GIB67_006116 [Kingdonia uniflora]
MSLTCGLECVACFGFTRWIYKRCTYIGSNDSITWPLSTPSEFTIIPHICRVILAVNEPDLHNPKFPPFNGGYRLNPDWVIKRVTYEQTQNQSPPYIIYLDHNNEQIILAVRGLNLAKESDYKVLLDNKLGMQMFDGGFVHHGLLKSAIWLLKEESETLKRLWVENGKRYQIVFAGHSLGSGVAALMAVLVVNHGDALGGVSRSMVKCYAVAPARCMSLNLAVKYADVINSVILQDDFLPRTATPLEDIFRSILCKFLGLIVILRSEISLSLISGLNGLDSLPCLLPLYCLRDTFIPEGRKLRDPRRLYAPGRMYHIVERKFCRCGRFPPEVRTAIPVEERFEHIVLSCNATSDHGIIWIEKEAQKALDMMQGDAETVTTAPTVPRFERMQTQEKEHKDALERAVTLNIPHSETLEEELPKDSETKNESLGMSKSNEGRTNWDHLVAKLFNRNKSGNLYLKKDIDAP